MMRCPNHGKRPSSEFRLIGKEVPHAASEDERNGARVEVWKHDKMRCGAFVWRLAESQRRKMAVGVN